MTDIPTPQAPLDPRAVMRRLNVDGTFAFSQVGFNEIDFGAVFGGKTTSSSQNTIGYGLQTFTLDVDDGKIEAGHTIQITSLDDPQSCFEYGLVLSKDATGSPALITVYIHTISASLITSANWEIQIVEVTRETTIDVGNENFTAEDHHRVIFYSTQLTAPRTLTLSSGASLIPGTRLLIVDAASPFAFSATNYLTVSPTGNVLETSGEFLELVWTGSAWEWFNQRGYVWTSDPGSFPLQIEEFDNSAAGGPNILLTKNSASPAAADNLAALQYVGKDSAANYETYGSIGAYILDPTNGSEDGALYVDTKVAGALVNQIKVEAGVSIGAATGGTKGTGTINAVSYYGQLVGTTTNDNATAGRLGEYVSSSVLLGSAVALTTNVVANVTSISLTAGDWDVWGMVAFDNTNATDITRLIGAISTTSATVPTKGDDTRGMFDFSKVAGALANTDPCFAVPQCRISISATTTVYLVAFALFTVSTLNGFGYIAARRAR